MHRAILLLSFAIPALAQNAAPDTQLTQALLTEIRQLRQDLQTTAVTIQRVQIVMYRLQAQTSAMNRATQRLDDARRSCTQSQMQRKMMTSEVERNEEKLRNTQNPAERKQLEDLLPRVKSNLDMWTTQEQQCHANETEADTLFRAERAKTTELEDQLDKLDRVLASIGK